MARTTEIELAGPADLPRIVELSNGAAEHTPANFATEPESLEDWTQVWRQTSPLHPWLVARTASRATGFAKSSPHRSRGAYRWMAEVSVYVDPEHHGQGVGTALYRSLIQALRSQGYVTLLAGITDGHEPSERLHTKFGFIRCGTFHRAGWKFGRWYDVGYWELHIQPPDHAPGPLRPVAEVWPGLSPGNGRETG